GDEVGFGVELDDRGGLAGAVGARGDGHQALGGDAVGPLGGLGQTLGAQPVERGVDVAVGVLQRLLAVHHADAGLLAQFLHQSGRDLRHGSLHSFKGLRPGQARPRSFRLVPDRREPAAPQPVAFSSATASRASVVASWASDSAAAGASAAWAWASSSALSSAAGAASRGAAPTGASEAPRSTPRAACPAARPSSTASAIRSQYIWMARAASSLPGIG